MSPQNSAAAVEPHSIPNGEAPPKPTSTMNTHAIQTDDKQLDGVVGRSAHSETRLTNSFAVLKVAASRGDMETIRITLDTMAGSAKRGFVGTKLLSLIGESDTFEIYWGWDIAERQPFIRLDNDDDTLEVVSHSPEDSLSDQISMLLWEVGLRAPYFDEFDVVVNHAPSILSKEEVRMSLEPCFVEGVSERFSTIEHFVETCYKEDGWGSKHGPTGRIGLGQLPNGEAPDQMREDSAEGKKPELGPPVNMDELTKSLHEMNFQRNREITLSFFAITPPGPGGSKYWMLTAQQVKMLFGIEENTLEGLAQIGVLKKAPMRRNRKATWRLIELQKLFSYPGILLSGKIQGF